MKLTFSIGIHSRFYFQIKFVQHIENLKRILYIA